jgi:hypothetical protein
MMVYCALLITSGTEDLKWKKATIAADRRLDVVELFVFERGGNFSSKPGLFLGEA